MSNFDPGDPVFGAPFPRGRHSISGWQTTWEEMEDYERHLRSMKNGYPRFVEHFDYQRLRDQNSGDALSNEFVVLCRTQKIANLYAEFTGASRISDTKQGFKRVIIPKTQECLKKAKQLWQHAGLIFPSREAENILNGTPEQDGGEAKNTIKKLISDYSGFNPEDMFLMLSGAASVPLILRVLEPLPTAQLGWPYVDSLKAQQVFGKDGIYFRYDNPADIDVLADYLSKNKIAGIFCEITSNPLLHTIDLAKLKQLSELHRIPLVIDDTIGTWANVDLSPYADILFTSLSKFASGMGNVIMGVVILNPNSKYYSIFSERIRKHYEDAIYGDDAIIMAENLRGYPERMKKINANGRSLANFFRNHPAIAEVYYPEFIDRQQYEEIMKEGGGFGGLMTITAKDEDGTRARRIYNRLGKKIGRAPGLGNEGTSACAYTPLAHWNELPWAAENGVLEYMLRSSAGAEDDFEEQVIKKQIEPALEF